MSASAGLRYPCLCCGLRSSVPRIMCRSCHASAEKHVGQPRTEWGKARKREREKAGGGP